MGMTNVTLLVAIPRATNKDLSNHDLKQNDMHCQTCMSVVKGYLIICICDVRLLIIPTFRSSSTVIPIVCATSTYLNSWLSFNMVTNVRVGLLYT